MNAKHRSIGRVGLILSGALAVAAAGCATHVHQRTVYVPPPVIVSPPPPVEVTPPPAPTPPPVPHPAVVVVPSVTAAPVVVIQSENDFREPLAPYGRWVVVAGYGYCWLPERMEVGWRPYSNGYWQRTDAGWYWMSEEPWGWATYHYGRWDWNLQFGWFWVPQTQWAPAWVAWREGGGYIGWAPLRPSVTVGVSLTSVHYEPEFASRAFVFVEQRRMLEPVRHKTAVVNNTTIINQTVNITKVSVVNKTVINEGPRPEVIERASGRKLATVAAREFRQREETAAIGRGTNTPRGNSRPGVEAAVQARPISHREPVVERASVVTQTPVTAREPKGTDARSQGQLQRKEIVRLDERKAESAQPVKQSVRAVTAPKQSEPLPVRTIRERPVVRKVTKPTEDEKRTPQQPMTTPSVPSDARVKTQQVSPVAPRPRPVVPNAVASPERGRDKDRPAKNEARPQPSRVSPANNSSSRAAGRNAEISSIDKQRSISVPEVRPDVRNRQRASDDR